ncbi:MAG: hypothetical protein EOO74_12375, partial [Myxococcales bacterium]
MLNEGASVKDAVLDVALRTKQNRQGHMTEIYRDWSSLKHGFDAQAAENDDEDADSITTTFIQQGAAATLGFLTFASQHVVDSGDDPAGFCPTGSLYYPGWG